MIRVIRKSPAVFILINLFVLSVVMCQERYYGSEAWEKHHNSLQPPEKVMDAIGVKPGMVVGEIGAGTGRYAVKLAGRVENTGKIYANDIDKGDLEFLRSRCKKNNIKNIEIITGTVDDPCFPEKALDMTFMINTYHHLDKPVELLKNIIPSLKPGATLVIVEHDPEKSAGATSNSSTSKKNLLKQADKAGFELVRTEDFLQNDTIFILRPKGSKQSGIKDEYLGQKKPGLKPEIFAPGIVSTEKNELNSVFSPDGKEFYYAINFPSKGYTIMVIAREKNRWTNPEVASFSGEYRDVDMCISYDGRKLFFCSNRPVDGSQPQGLRIWVTEKKGDKWGKPVYLRSGINAGRNQVYPSVTKKETLYFQSRREGNFGGSDIYRSRFVNGKFMQPENLGSMINSEFNEGDVLIAPDESYIIVSCSGRPDSFGGGDLYISFKKNDGSWAKLKNMGKTFNTTYTEYCPMLSPDGKYLFFTSKKTGNGDIYWVSAKFIEELKPDELK